MDEGGEGRGLGGRAELWSGGRAARCSKPWFMAEGMLARVLEVRIAPASIVPLLNAHIKPFALVFPIATVLYAFDIFKNRLIWHIACADDIIEDTALV